MLAGALGAGGTVGIDVVESTVRGAMAEPVRARRLSDEEGQTLQRIVRRGKHGSIRVRRALIVMASASGTTVPAIARLVQADADTVRDPGKPPPAQARRGPTGLNNGYGLAFRGSGELACLVLQTPFRGRHSRGSGGDSRC